MLVDVSARQLYRNGGVDSAQYLGWIGLVMESAKENEVGREKEEWPGRGAKP